MNFSAKGTKAHKDLIKHKKRKVQFRMTGISSETREKNGKKTGGENSREGDIKNDK